MSIETIRWEIISNSDLDNNSMRLGYVNDRLLFQIQVTGSKVYHYKLFSYPLKDTIFVAGNNTKLLVHKKSETGFKSSYVLLLMNDAEDLLNEFINLFSKKPVLYKVKLTPEGITYFNAITHSSYLTEDGYLKDGITDNVGLYTRGDAIKKARNFNGKIEKV